MPIVLKTGVIEIEESKTWNYSIASNKHKFALTLFSLFLSVVKKFFFFHQNRSINIGSHSSTNSISLLEPYINGTLYPVRF